MSVRSSALAAAVAAALLFVGKADAQFVYTSGYYGGPAVYSSYYSPGYYSSYYSPAYSAWDWGGYTYPYSTGYYSSYYPSYSGYYGGYSGYYPYYAGYSGVRRGLRWWRW